MNVVELINARNSSRSTSQSTRRGPVVSHYIGNNIPVIGNSCAIEVEKAPENPEELRPSFVGSDGVTYVLDVETEQYRPADEGVAEEQYYGDYVVDVAHVDVPPQLQVI